MSKYETIDDREAKVCASKTRYNTPREAEEAIELMGMQQTLKAYACRVCGGWHLTKDK